MHLAVKADNIDVIGLLLDLGLGILIIQVANLMNTPKEN